MKGEKPMQIWFDMDGTIANLFAVNDWLKKLNEEDASPYAEAAPMLNMSLLARYLNKCLAAGCEVGIISWTSKGGSRSYNDKVASAKREWLKHHLPSVSFTHIDIVEYGIPKECGRSGILFDDLDENRQAWGAGAYSPDEIIKVLKEVVK